MNDTVQNMRAQDLIESAVASASPSLSRVGRWMTAHPISTLSQSAEEIASFTGTSVAAINRFSRMAGFEGFAHLKTVLGDELQSSVQPLQKLGGANQKPSRGRKGSAQNSPSAIDGEALQRAATDPHIQRAAGRLLKARQVLLLGLGTGSYLAGYAAHVLMPYLPHVWSVGGEGGTEEAARRLARCGSGDALLAISLPRYSRDTVRLADFARERGVYVIAITDTAEAPLARIAQSLLLAPGEHALLPSSALGALAVIESLATTVIRVNPEAERVARDLSELVVSQFTTAHPQRKTRSQAKEKS